MDVSVQYIHTYPARGRIISCVVADIDKAFRKKSDASAVYQVDLVVALSQITKFPKIHDLPTQSHEVSCFVFGFESNFELVIFE